MLPHSLAYWQLAKKTAPFGDLEPVGDNISQVQVQPQVRLLLKETIGADSKAEYVSET